MTMQEYYELKERRKVPLADYLLEMFFGIDEGGGSRMTKPYRQHMARRGVEFTPGLYRSSGEQNIANRVKTAVSGNPQRLGHPLVKRYHNADLQHADDQAQEQERARNHAAGDAHRYGRRTLLNGGTITYSPKVTVGNLSSEEQKRRTAFNRKNHGDIVTKAAKDALHRDALAKRAATVPLSRRGKTPVQTKDIGYTYPDVPYNSKAKKPLGTGGFNSDLYNHSKEDSATAHFSDRTSRELDNIAGYVGHAMDQESTLKYDRNKNRTEIVPGRLRDNDPRK